MRLLPVLLAIVALAAGMRNADHKAYLEHFFGEGVDIDVINKIVAEEARSLGISSQKHFYHCLLQTIESNEGGNLIARKAHFDEGLKEFLEQVGKMRFASVDKVMDVLQEKAPKAHASFTWLFKEIVGRLDKEAAVFAVELKDALLKMLYNHVALHPRTHARMYGHALKKIYADFDALSDYAKADIEKKTCFRTTFRLFDATGEQKGQITELKKMIKDLIKFADY